MAATGKSSSKRKSSSSSHKKKKSIKDSSEVKKRRSKSHRRNKSKKLLRRSDASVSYSEEDSRRRNEEDSLSISSSDSEDDYRSRRARSRTRKDDDKGSSSKKRVRRRSSSSSEEDNEDSPSPRRKKKKKKKVSKRNVDRKDSPSRKKEKGLKRKDESEGKKKKKKTHQIKCRPNERPKRDKSVDSVGSDSRSCSTYQDESSGSGERGFGRSRGRSVGRREKGKRSVIIKTDIERDRYMYRSRSCSSGSDHPSIYRSEERLTSENYSRRLQSVLIDAKASNEAEGRYQSKDENKTEIIQDYDDYPSSRSNDSYDGGRKKDSSHHTHAVSEKKRKVDDLMVEEALTSKSRNTEYAQRSREDAGIQSANSNPAKDVAEPTKMVTKTAISTGIGSSEVDDLETILRLKALENLKKFRGGLNTNTSALAIKNNESDNAVMQPSTAKADSTKPQIRKEAGQIVASAKNMVVNPIKRVSVPTVQRSPGVNTNMSALGIQKNASDDAVVKQPSTAKADSSKPQIRKEAGEIVASAKNMVVNPIKRVGAPTVQRSPGVNTNVSALGIQKNVSHNAVVKQPSTVKADTAKSHIREGAGHIVAASKDMVVQPMKNVSGPTMERNSAPKNNSRILNRNCKPSESKAQLNASTHVVMGAGNSLPDQVVSGKTIERSSTNVDVITNKATNTSTLEQESPSDHSIFHQAPISPDIPKVKLLDSNNIADKNVVETAKAADGFSNAHGAEVIKTCESAALEASSYITPVTGEHGSNEPGDLAKGSSQFEQKTMSVMRGGELVQVSYKVYIPKKPPALARRKLQR